VLVFSLTAHEYAHGVAALREGDDTAYMLGRLTLNPLPHIDPWLSVILPALLWFGTHGAFTFGGAKPVPVNPRKYRKYKRGDIVVSAAGVTTNLLIAVTCALLFVAIGLAARTLPALQPTLDTAQRMMMLGIEINLMLCFFNLIPIPPLDGSHLFYHLLPPGLGARYRSLQRFGFLPLMLLLLVGQPVLGLLLKPVSYGMEILLHFVLPYAVGDGWNIFQS
jgi:Zn-dependent protease